MYSSRVCFRSASTAHGMRRILKKLPPVQQYIGQAVRAGIYYKEDNDGGGGAKDRNQQQRNKSPKRTSPIGTSIQDYPVEYEILTMNPPIPEQPRTPKKFQPKAPPLPTTKLAKKQLKRLQHQEEERELTIDDYYERLLGIPAQNKTSFMALKSSHINKAYAFAMKQYEVMRTEHMSEDEALKVVNEMLEQQSVKETRSSREIAKDIVEETKEEKQESSSMEEQQEAPPKKHHDEDLDASAIPSVLHSKPRTIRGMHAWSQRLAIVPYKDWTVGATTALDHWIARSILDLDESTWLELLEGNNPSLTSRGHDILAVRRALFPETLLDGKQDDDMVAEDEEESAFTTSSDKSIDELLASLGAFDDEDDEDDFAGTKDDANADNEISGLVEELQEWRRKNQSLPYKEWSEIDQEEFMTWLERYVATFVTEADGEVDFAATRQALLEVPPMTEEESSTFWNHLKDEATVDEYLQSLASMDTGGLSEKQKSVLAAFLSLPYKFKVNKLVELGALEPLLNEYTPEPERVLFVKRHSDKLLAGLSTEHLVPDANGPIVAQDMGHHWMEQHGVDKDERFSIKKDVVAASRVDLIESFSTHKAKRAQYEEIMFQKGKLGLQYSDEPKDAIDEEE